jgi:uncharacterized secreted repeat protein (TIGR03808 family)
MRCMTIDRRTVLLGSLAAALAAPAKAVQLSNFGLDAAYFGVRAGAPGDQSGALQRAIDEAARTRVPLLLAPGVYRTGGLTLPRGAQLAGVPGATRLTYTQGPSLLSAEHTETISLSGLTLDGGNQMLPAGRALAHFDDIKSIRITECEIAGAGGNGITLESCDGEVTHSTITGAAQGALYCNDGRGLIIADNTVLKSGNNGIQVWQSDRRYDGTLIADNRVEDTTARAGGSGQYGNAISIFRAGNVIVRGNHIRNAAFSAIRGNSASDIQIVGNNCAELGEVAIYSEFGFQGAVIADNVIDGTETGISITNFDEGGRLATVTGNLVRNLRTQRPGEAGNGISVEVDTVVSGNVVEGAPLAAISAGWGIAMRDLAVTGNVVRKSALGVSVSVVNGTGVAVIANNIFSDTADGAIVAMEWHKKVSGDLALAGVERYPQLRIRDNQVS